MKDISKEEQSNLFLSGIPYKDPVKLTNADRSKLNSSAGSVFQCGLTFSVNFGGKLPLTYYNLINEEISRRDDGGRDNYGLIPGINQDVPNPNALNRPLAWPIKIKTSVSTTDQVRGYCYIDGRAWWVGGVKIWGKKGLPSSDFSYKTEF